MSSSKSPRPTPKDSPSKIAAVQPCGRAFWMHRWLISRIHRLKVTMKNTEEMFRLATQLLLFTTPNAWKISWISWSMAYEGVNRVSDGLKMLQLWVVRLSRSFVRWEDTEQPRQQHHEFGPLHHFRRDGHGFPGRLPVQTNRASGGKVRLSRQAIQTMLARHLKMIAR